MYGCKIADAALNYMLSAGYSSIVDFHLQKLRIAMTTIASIFGKSKF